jgi:hypothetical protein
MMNRNIIVSASVLMFGAAAVALACPPEVPSSWHGAPVSLPMLSSPPLPASQHVVELAICLDTSGSMDGLIEAAKIKLWDIVNDLALAKPVPKLRVALLTYGNDGHNAENGWVNIDTSFTEDLDLVSQKLFALKTNGGTELVARVIKAAHEQLPWTPSDDALKLVVVAGNESADQDQQFSFRDVCKATISKGIMVNSIYCGNPADDIAPGWKEVATLADGHFAAIDHNTGTVVISTPFDDELTTLSAALNTTYIAYGAEGKRYAENQAMQDTNAAALGTAVAAQRCGTKGGSIYRNSQWDLVDACKEAVVKIEDVNAEDLPENMRTMTIEQRKQLVDEMTKKRSEIQANVNELMQKRQAFVNEEIKKANVDGDKAFDVAIRKAIRAQAESKGFKFEEPKTVSSTSSTGS